MQTPLPGHATSGLGGMLLGSQWPTFYFSKQALVQTRAYVQFFVLLELMVELGLHDVDSSVYINS